MKIFTIINFDHADYYLLLFRMKYLSQYKLPDYLFKLFIIRAASASIMSQQLADIFLQSQDGKYAYQADQLLIQYKQQTNDYFSDVLQLLFHQNNVVSYVAAIQMVNLFKRYQDIEIQKLVDIAQGILNQYQQMHPQTRRHITNIMPNICAYLYFSDTYATLPNKIAILLQQSTDNIDLFVDYYKFLEKLYTYKAGIELNDQIAMQLKELLDKTQALPIESFDFIEQQQGPNKKSLQLSYSSIIASAYSWEDLPDYFNDNLIKTIQQMLQLLQQTQDNRLDVQIDENCLNVVVNIIQNHNTEIEDQYKNALISCMINYLETKISSEREYILSRIILNFTRWYMSPELGEYLQGTYNNQLINAAIRLLNFNENALSNAQNADSQFILNFASGKDDFSVNCASEQFLITAKSYQKELEQVIQAKINELDPFDTFQLFRILAIKSQSISYGIQINEQYQDFIAQYIQTMIRYDNNKILTYNYLIQSQFIKLLDFTAVINQQLSQQLYLKIQSLYLQSNNTHELFMSLIAICSFKIIQQLNYMQKTNNIQSQFQDFAQFFKQLYIVIFSDMTSQLSRLVLLSFFSQTMTGAIKINPQIISQLDNLSENILALLKVQLADCNQEIVKNLSLSLIETCKNYNVEYCYYVINQLKQILSICQQDNLQDCFMFTSQIIVLIYKNAQAQQANGQAALYQVQVPENVAVTQNQIQEILSSLINISVSVINHEQYPDLVQIFFLIACNLLSINAFPNVEFKHTTLQFDQGQGVNGLNGVTLERNNQNMKAGDNQQLQIPAEQISQSQMLIQIIQHGIQIQSLAASAYQCLNYLLSARMDMPEEQLSYICQYNLQRIASLYNNVRLLRETCIFYGYVFSKLMAAGGIVAVNNFFERINIKVQDVLRKVVLIGCQSSFSIVDGARKVFLCEVLIQLCAQDQGLKNMVIKCVGALVGRIRDQKALTLVRQEKVMQVTYTCLLDGIQGFEPGTPPGFRMSELESECKRALGITAWSW